MSRLKVLALAVCALVVYVAVFLVSWPGAAGASPQTQVRSER